METHIKTLDKILEDGQQWVVPLYQRHYKWTSGEDGQIPQFWEDWSAQSQEILDEGDQYTAYLGAIIYSNAKQQPFVGHRRLLVDGQQRITTFNLALVALREVAEGLEQSELAGEINKYLFFGVKDIADENGIGDLKIIPTTHDRDLYHSIVTKSHDEVVEGYKKYFFDNGNIRTQNTPRMLRAYHYFYQAISNFVEYREDEEGDAPEDTLKALWESLRTLFRVVVIELGEHDNAQEIFAALNGRSEPLTPFELVRNDIFQRASLSEADYENLFNNKWKEFEGEFWSTEVGKARNKKAHSDHFLMHFVFAQESKQVNIKRIAVDYRRYAIDSDFSSVAEELDVLRGYAETYKHLENATPGVATEKIANVLKSWDTVTFYPFIMRINALDIADSEKIRIFDVLENHIIRRYICGSNAEGYNKSIPPMVRVIQSSGNIVDALINYLNETKAKSFKSPTDSEVLDACEREKIPVSAPKLRYILGTIEKNMRSARAEPTPLDVSKLTIEHIMPKKWSTYWSLRDGKKVDYESPNVAEKDGVTLSDETRNAMIERNKMVGTIGNLTIITQKLNAGISNNPWKDKKDALGEESVLVMNREIVRTDDWNEDAIRTRSRNLAEHINKIWPDGR